MTFGAHETMEVHESLNEQINLINHLSLYAEQAHNGQVKSLIDRQMQHMIQSYNQLVSYTHNYQAAQAGSPMTQTQMMNNLEKTSYQDIHYGLQQPPQVSPQMKGRFNDQQILSALLILHKNSAKNAMSASLECADPNLRHMLMNQSIACANQAFETFYMMNQQGQYQVPTMNDQTAKTFLNTYQPINAVNQFQ